MSWTKRQYIVDAFEEIGLASYVYDLQPEQLQSAALLFVYLTRYGIVDCQNGHNYYA